MESTRILVVDRDAHIAAAVSAFLQESNFDVSTCPDPAAALERIADENFQIAIVDQDACSQNGIDFMRAVQLTAPDLAVILLTGFGTIESAVEAVRSGAFDYLSKPVVDQQLDLAVRRALSQQALVAENRTLRRTLDRHRQLEKVVGTSDRMNHIFEVVESVAPTRATVLITGESGTGKTLLARAIHRLSPRAGKPFVEVNCGALPDTLLESELFGHAKGAFTGAVRDKPGKFEQADGGTMFLDEISDASTALQVKLLRVIQDRRFERIGETRTRKTDVRILLATNRKLMRLVEKGDFREDLYYRINVINIDVPPLRERQEDIPYLLDHFLSMYTEYHGKKIEGISPEALDYLLSHSWPGNIRELENAVERAVVLTRGAMIDTRDLPPSLTRKERPLVELREQVLPLKKALEAPERHIIQRALELNGWNRQKTADMLEVNRTTLFHKMRKHGLLPGKERHPSL